jgi:multimeric flavodoxin WrbA
VSTRRILILKSSPRKRGNSSLLADQVGAGAAAAGAQVECVELHGMDIRPCDACDFCQGQEAGHCVINDDMQELYPRLLAADGIVVAGPIYWFTISAQAKLCIDRWYALQGTAEHGLAGKHIGIVLTYGDADPLTSGAINAIHMFQDMFRYVHADITGVIHGSASEAGEIQGRPELLRGAYELGQQLGRGD